MFRIYENIYKNSQRTQECFKNENYARHMLQPLENKIQK